MPLLQFDLIEGRTEAELKTILDAAHRAMLAAFTVPERDRFQIVHEHKRSQMIIEDGDSASSPATRSWSCKSPRVINTRGARRSHSTRTCARNSSGRAASAPPMSW